MDVVLRCVRGITGSPLQHRERAALERHQVEEPATVLERNPVLHFDQAGGSGPIFEHALFNLNRPIRWADQ
jgi:hypothetical protein